MPHYYEVACKGIALDKPIVNVLYYKIDTEYASARDHALMQVNLATVVGNEILLPLSQYLTSKMSWVDVEVWEINLHKERQQTAPINRAALRVGSQGGTLDGTGHTAILSFRGLPLVDDEYSQIEPLRHSYIALGPIRSSDIGDNQRLLWGSDVQDAVIGLYTQILTLPAAPTDAEAIPIRVAKTEPSGTLGGENPKAIEVFSASLAPFSGIRRSRLRNVR